MKHDQTGEYSFHTVFRERFVDIHTRCFCKVLGMIFKNGLFDHFRIQQTRV